VLSKETHNGFFQDFILCPSNQCFSILNKISHTNVIQDTEQRFEEEKTDAYDKLSQFLVTLIRT
jgi:cell shape-determining protein MreC